MSLDIDPGIAIIKLVVGSKKLKQTYGDSSSIHDHYLNNRDMFNRCAEEYLKLYDEIGGDKVIGRMFFMEIGQDSPDTAGDNNEFIDFLRRLDMIRELQKK